MHLKYHFEIMDIEGERFAVPMEDCEGNFSGVIKLTGTAAVIFDLLKEETDEASIVEYMSQQYDVSRDILAADIHRMLLKLEAKGLLA
ncbi:MAG: PqqD family protein [Clostridia bacterium]|nr:PqqD family protein [Clostridia bacterium]